MIFKKFIVSFNIDKLNKEDILKLCTPNPIKEFDKVLSYLKNRQPAACGSISFIDKIKNVVVYDSDNAFYDGEYTWYTPEIYYFEKYNLKLNDDFIEYVLSKYK